MTGIVTAVSRSATHTMSKPNQTAIRLVEGLGVEQDAHLGVTVKHRSRVKLDPSQPNLRQVHLIHAELHDELRQSGLPLSRANGRECHDTGCRSAGLAGGTRLRLGETATVEVTGLRNPLWAVGRYSAGPDGGDARSRRGRAV